VFAVDYAHEYIIAGRDTLLSQLFAEARETLLLDPAPKGFTVLLAVVIGVVELLTVPEDVDALGGVEDCSPTPV
jgi:hypothetical protein